jgi:FkbM family methyltransferase
MKEHIYNSEYAQHEFEQHGETWLQNRFAGKFKTIFDVGSNIGEWSKMARKYHPDATIHMFELVPETYHKMLLNTTLDSKIIPNSFGLSDETKFVKMKYKSDYDALSTTVLDLKLDSSEIRSGLTVTGDDYVKSRLIDRIDFLKIDTEGHEGRVFKGFENTLREGKVKMLQFEYSFVCVLTKWMLIDSYKFLEPLGFKLGKLNKDHIEFHDYTLLHETFAGPEYVAVHENYWNEME